MGFNFVPVERDQAFLMPPSIKAELVDASVVAVDGTKIKANASSRRNLTEEQLQELAREVIEDARRIDEEEDKLFGDRRGEELPPHLIDQEGRRRWIREQLEEVQATQAKSSQGRSRTPRVNTTDPESRTIKAPGGYIQGYNAQSVVDRNGIVIAADVSNSASDAPLFQPMLEAAAAELGMSVPGVWSMKQRYIKDGRKGVELRSTVAPPRGPTAKQRMADKLKDPRARDLYALRSVLVEPLFGETKWVRGFERFLLRGERGCRTEWMLMMTTRNLRRLKAGLKGRLRQLFDPLPVAA